MTDIKNKTTNACGLLIVIAGAILSTETQGVLLPQWVKTTCYMTAAISIAIVAYLTGKTHNGKRKTNNDLYGHC